MTQEHKQAEEMSAVSRRDAIRKLGKYGVGGGVAVFSLTARSQSVTNCGTNHEDDPSDGSGGSHCDRGKFD